ncbi:MAG: transposase [Marinoscillum sp.]
MATRWADCRDCPFKEDCIGNKTEKRFKVVKPHQRVPAGHRKGEQPKGQYYKRKRQATVEPVLGVLTQFMGMRKVYTKGIHNANKQFIMAAIAYNLKKYLKFDKKTIQTQRGISSVLQKAINWLDLVAFHLLFSIQAFFDRYSGLSPGRVKFH